MSETYVYVTEAALPVDEEGRQPLFVLRDDLDEMAGEYLADAIIEDRGAISIHVQDQRTAASYQDVSKLGCLCDAVLRSIDGDDDDGYHWYDEA